MNNDEVTIIQNLSPSNSNVKNFIDETEKVVLGACLRIPENIPIVLDSLSAEDFFSSRNRIIFSTIKILSEKGALINPLSLSVELRVKGNTISTSEILEIEDQYIDGLDLNYPIGQLKMFSKRKKLENFLVDACQKVQDFSIEYPELEKNIVQKIMSILNDGLPGKSPVPPSLSDISNLDTKVEWFVDKLIPKQAITVLHGKGGIGKTWIMLQIGSCVADGKNFMGLKTHKDALILYRFRELLAGPPR